MGRVDLQRGPNSILFGIGSPAGIINTSVNDAAFKTAYNYENRVDQYGSLRNSISLNQELVKGVLAIRVAALKDDELFEQKPAFNNTDRFYGALRFDPKLFGDDNRTSIRAKYEQGKVTSNNPRSIPPGDNQSLWFKTGVDAQGNPVPYPEKKNTLAEQDGEVGASITQNIYRGGGDEALQDRAAWGVTAAKAKTGNTIADTLSAGVASYVGVDSARALLKLGEDWLSHSAKPKQFAASHGLAEWLMMRLGCVSSKPYWSPIHAIMESSAKLFAMSMPPTVVAISGV